MALNVGDRLGHYDVTALIGEGGMGQVYRATDTQLDRDVALKVLPEAFTSDPERLARFEREAKVLASLNHPGIAAIYGIEEAGDTRALVLELVEGPTLADRIAQSPIPLDEALPIAKQIAEALEAAHDQGIIHRDLKPANVKVKDDGTVKVLDFGLAKAFQPDAGSDPSESPTLTAAATRAGVILGTAAYMSPEQAKGKAVDRRTDVWAFGCVFYEMLTGQRAFAGDSVSETLVAVLSHEADLGKLPAAIPPAGRRLLRRCFEKERTKRLRDTTEGLLQLEEDLEGRSGEPTASVMVSPRVGPARRALPWVAAVGLAVVAGIAGWNVRPTSLPALDTLSVALPAETRLPREMLIVAAISPDGRDLVFTGEQRGGETQLYHRPMDRADAVPIPDTSGAANPFFSPDGEWVAFYVGNELKRVPLAGGTSETICVIPGSGAGDAVYGAGGSFRRGAAWGEDDTIWLGGNTGLYRVAASGGVPQQVTAVNARTPQVLPDGRGILYSAGALSIGLYRPDTGEHQVLVENGVRPWFASSGHVVFSRPVGGSARPAEVEGLEGTLWAFPFDVDQLKRTGEPVLVRDGVRVSAGGGTTQAYLGLDGTLVYVEAGASPDARTLVWVDQYGNEEPVRVPPGAYETPRLSPDDTRVVVAMNGDIWILDLVDGSSTPLTVDPRRDRRAIWTPDGQRVVFASDRASDEGLFGLFSKAVDGTVQVDSMLSVPRRNLSPYSWSGDGSTLLMVVEPRFTIGALGRAGGWVPLAGATAAAGCPEVSPDGRWLAYCGNSPVQTEIYLTAFPDMDEHRLLSSDGGIHPVWSRDGRKVFYRRDAAFWSVSVDPDPAVTLGTPDRLFEDTYDSPDLGRHYDVARDGRFLMIKGSDTEATLRHIHVVRNWVEELKERVPVN